MFVLLQGVLYLVVVFGGVGAYVECVGVADECFEGVVGGGVLESVLAEFGVEGEVADDSCAVDVSALEGELVDDVGVADESEAQGVLFAAYLGAGDALRAVEVDHLAVLFEVVEDAHPVGAYGEDVDAVLLDVVYLLSLVLFYDDFVGESCGAHGFDAFHERLLHVDFAARDVEVVAGDAYDEVVAEGAGTFQEPYVPEVQEVVGAVGDDFLHKSPRFCRSLNALMRVVLSSWVRHPMCPTRNILSAMSPPFGHIQMRYSSLRILNIS